MKKSENNKYHMISLICGILKKRGRNKLIYKTERDTDVENKFMLTRGWREINWKIGIDIYTLLYTK